MLDEESKVIAIDEETDHQIVHCRHFGKTNRTTHKMLDACAQIDVLAFDFLRILLAYVMLFGGDMPFVRPPSIGVKTGDAKRLQQRSQLQKEHIFPLSEDIRQYSATPVIDGMPQPARLRFLPRITPHLIEL